jgi:hypothetical protein
MMSSQASKQPPRQASMTALDLDDDNVRPNAWFAYVMPVQMGVEMMGAGRYGYWDNRPTVTYDSDYVDRSGGHEARSRSWWCPRRRSISVYVVPGQAHPRRLRSPCSKSRSSGS